MRSAASTTLAYLQLFRAPNVFTAVADVMMGFLVTQTHESLESWGVFALLVAASVSLYTAGMVLNDVYDVDVDARERPQRPIPSGRVSLGFARLLGFELLVLGAALGWAAGYLAADIRAGLVASGLAVCVWLYDAVLKRTPLGPLAMGCCRALNVLLGMSAAAGAWQAAHGLIAAGIGVYVAGVTWFARREARESSRLQLTLATGVMLSGIFLLSQLPAWSDAAGLAIKVPLDRWHLFWAFIAVLIAWRCVRAIVDPAPPHVQAAVKQGIMSLFILDAALIFAVHGFAGPGVPWAVLALLLALPAMVLGWWIYST